MIGKDVWFDNVSIQHYNSIVLEEDHYYPFGLTMNINATNVQAQKNPYKLTTKELESKFDLNMYDFGARNFDMTIGRWTSVDPLSERYYHESQYAYCGNNPISMVDFNGKSYNDATVTSQMDKSKNLHVTSTSTKTSSTGSTKNGVTTNTTTKTTITVTNIISNSETKETSKGDVVTTTETTTTVIKNGKLSTSTSTSSTSERQKDSKADLSALDKATSYLENFRDKNHMQYNEAVFKQAGLLKYAMDGAIAPFPGAFENNLTKFLSLGGVSVGTGEVNAMIQGKLLPSDSKIALPATVLGQRSDNLGGREYRNEPSQGVKSAQQFLYNITFGLFD